MTTYFDDGNEKQSDTHTELISKTANIFRSKMIHEFNLFENVRDYSESADLPHLFPADITDERKSTAMMISEPSSLVKFRVSSKKRKTRDSVELSRTSRHSNSLVSALERIVNKRWYNVSVIVTLLINLLVVGVDVQLNYHFTGHHPAVELVLDVISIIVLLILLSNTILTSFANSNSRAFWTNKWNIFDLIAIVFSISVEILKTTSVSSDAKWYRLLTLRLTSLRVICSVKVLSHFRQFVVLLRTIERAGQELLLISVLIFVIAYIYAVIGVAAFDYRTIDPNDSIYVYFTMSVDTVFHSLETIFQIATIDHWIPLMQEFSLTESGILSYFFVISWLFLGGYLLINLITGSLVSYYVTVQVEMANNSQRNEAAKQAEGQLQQLITKLDQETPSSTRGSQMPIPLAMSSVTASLPEESGAFQSSALSAHDWHMMVEQNLSNLARDSSTFYWPADTLFQYYYAMEALQENLEERKRLLQMMTQALLALNDT